MIGQRAWMARVGATVSYDSAVRSTWMPLQAEGGLSEVVRYATLAANSHNTQPWKFSIEDHQIGIAADQARRCPVVDPDDHHLYASLGCAAENLIHAAGAVGLRAAPMVEGDGITIELDGATPRSSALFDAIPRRQSTRAAYDGKPVSSGVLRLLEEAGHGSGVSPILITGKAGMAQIRDYVLEGNGMQMRDRAFMDELKGWLRFSEKDAVGTRDGLFSRASGNPAMPAWMARLLLPLVFREGPENDKYRAQIDSSAGLAIFVSDQNDKRHWIEAGRVCQRFALQATVLGLKVAFVNQPVEIPALRHQFASFLSLNERRPNFIMRFGVGPDLPRSLRRPVEQVLA
jgi:nitroreductase